MRDFATDFDTSINDVWVKLRVSKEQKKAQIQHILLICRHLIATKLVPQSLSHRSIPEIAENRLKLSANKIFIGWRSQAVNAVWSIDVKKKKRNFTLMYACSNFFFFWFSFIQSIIIDYNKQHFIVRQINSYLLMRQLSKKSQWIIIYFWLCDGNCCFDLFSFIPLTFEH